MSVVNGRERRRPACMSVLDANNLRRRPTLL